MKRTPATLLGAVLALLAMGRSDLRAELIHWSYAWSSSPGVVLADSPGTGKIILTNEDLRTAAGSSNIVATNIQTSSTASPGSPDTFTSKGYSLTLTLVDNASAEEGTLVFTGEFNGTMTQNSSNIKNTFTGETEQSIILGNNRYTVTIGPYSPPGPGDSTNLGSIAAHAQVKVERLIQTPEPGSLLMGGAGVGMALLGWWRNGRSRRGDPAGPS